MDIDKLLTGQPLDTSVSKTAFLEDVDCLMALLHDCYGGYDHFGHERFQAARDNVLLDMEAGYDFHRAVESLKTHFYGAVKDGHFSVGATDAAPDAFDYAVRFDRWNGIPVIDCKKFWYDTPEEKAQLGAFVQSAGRYRNDAPLIIDLRDNPGGSDVYIYEFLRGLFGVEPCYSCRFVQRYSPLFREALKRQSIPARYMGDVEITEDDAVPIESRKPIYVLINEKTCSSGESAVAYLKTVSSAVTVGTHTGGAFSFGNCVRVWLPNSHLPVYFGTGMVLYEKTRNIDAEGGFRGDLSMDVFYENIRHK